VIDSPFVQIDSIGSGADTVTIPGPYATNLNYSFRVRAISDSNASKYTNTVTVNIPYPAPFNLQVGSNNDSTMNLTWQDTSGIKRSFEVDMSGDGSNFSVMELFGASGGVNNTFSATITYHYLVGQNYYFRVRSASSYNVSPYSNIADTSAAFLSPTSLMLADSSSAGVKLKWKNGSRFSNQFRIEREMGSGGFTFLANVGSTMSTYSETGLDPSQVYQYRVRAESGSFSSGFTQPLAVKFTISKDYTLIWTLTGHSDEVGNVAISQDNKTIVSASSDRTIKVWRVSDGVLLRSIKLRGSIFGFPPAMCLAGNYVAVCDTQNVINVYDMTSWSVVKTLVTTDANLVIGLAFSPDGKYLGAVNVGTMTIWRVSDWSKVMTAVSSTDRLEYSLSFSPDDDYVVAGSGGYNSGDASIVQVSTGLETTLLPSGSWGVMWGVSFSPDGETVAVTTEGSQILIFRASDGALLHALSPTNPQPTVCVAYCPAGNVLAAGGQNCTIDIWDNQLSHVQALPEGYTVQSIAFSHDGLYMASGNIDQNVRLYKNAGSWGMAH
jgi:WD40 repeat protein